MKTTILIVLFLLFVPFFLYSEPGIQEKFAYSPDPPKVSVRSAVVLDYTTGEIIFEKNPQLSIPPASLTKLMAIHVALKQAKHGVISLDETVDIPKQAYAYNMPPRSSLMFLGPDQRVTVWELLEGMAIASGNDAAVALAYHVAGGVEEFVYLMNKEAEAMGLTFCRFEDPAGLSAENTVTAAEYARFCRKYIEQHPETLDALHSVGKYTYPKKENILSDANQSPITQYNRNMLLSVYPDADGLKTGYIDESGYNLAATAERNGMRLVAVFLGGEGNTHYEGISSVARDAQKVFEYCFEHYITLKPANVALEPVRVWKGKADFLRLETAGPVIVTVPKAVRDNLSIETTIDKRVVAPVFKGDKLGALTVTANGRTVKRMDLLAAQPMEEAGLIGRGIDSVRLWLLTRKGDRRKRDR